MEDSSDYDVEIPREFWHEVHAKAKKAQSIVGTNKGENSGVLCPELDFYPTPRRGTVSRSDIRFFKRRLKFTRNGDENIKGGGMIAFAWFIWERNYLGCPIIGWI